LATYAAAQSNEPPLWPVGLKLPAEMTAKWKPMKDQTKAEILVWSPKQVRAVLLIPENTDSKHFGEHAALRAVAEKRGLGIVYLRRFDANQFEFTDPPAVPDAIQRALDEVAKQTGIAEYRTVPWIVFGKSSRGRFPHRTAWMYPERVIASIAYHGEVPVWPIPDWAKKQDQTILHVNANGEDEWDRTWYRHVRPFLLNYRNQTAWLPHQIVAHGVGHGNYVDGHGSPGWGKPVPEGSWSVLRTWDYLALFIDKAIGLRLGADGKLKPVDPDTGYLIHPRAVEEMLKIRWRPLRQTDGVYTHVDHIKEPGEVYDPNPGKVEAALLVRKATDVPANERKNYLWVADKELADAWIEFHHVK
jgi:hypothetical protein